MRKQDMHPWYFQERANATYVLLRFFFVRMRTERLAVGTRHRGDLLLPCEESHIVRRVCSQVDPRTGGRRAREDVDVPL